MNQMTIPQGEGELSIELTGSVFEVDNSLSIELILDSQ